MPDFKNPLAPKREKPKKPTYNFTAEQIDQMIKDAEHRAFCDAIYICNAMCSVAVIKMLRDHLGFGMERRIPDAFRFYQGVFESVRDGYINYFDCVDNFRDELKLRLHAERPDGVRDNLEELFKRVAKAEKRKIVMEFINGGKEK